MHIAQGFCFHFINGGREARGGILWLSNTILLSPAHQAEAWEEQTSSLLYPNRFVETRSANCHSLCRDVDAGETGGSRPPTPRVRPESDEAPSHPISALTCLADPASKPALSPGSSLGLPTRFLPRPRDGNVHMTCVSQQAFRPLNKIQTDRHKEKMRMATIPAALCRQWGLQLLFHSPNTF